VGNGRVLIWTTTIDRDWTDLPFKTSFLPLIQQAMLYLGGKVESEGSHTLEVGHARQIRTNKDVSKVNIIRPDGNQVAYLGADLATGEIRYEGTEVPGIYRIERQRRQVVEQEQFAVHLSASESQLKAVDKNVIQRLLESSHAEGPAITNDEGTGRANTARQGELWPALLMGLFLLLGVETWLAFAPS
jgi:hypothetical protein